MSELLFVSILLVIANIVPPAGIVQMQEPGFETQEECVTWIKKNTDEIVQNLMISFGPWARIEGMGCMTESDARDLNQKWGHKSVEDYEKEPDNFLKDFGGDKTL